MAFVWRHPSLTALELLWRWLAAAPLLWLAFHSLAPRLAAIPLDTAALQSMTFFDPVRSVATLTHQLRPYLAPLAQTGKWWIPLALLAWTAAATLGRTAILLRAAGRLPAPGLLTTAGYTLLRALAFLALLALWLRALLAAVHLTITNHSAEPNLVLFTAAAVALTLAAFLLWSLTVWALDLAPIERLTRTHPQTPRQRRQLRSKLIETNLVMGIVRVALFVLAMTFSASPLPFQSNETQAYINAWWLGVALFYLLSSDFFHVVRRVTYLRLLQTIANQTNVPSPPAS